MPVLTCCNNADNKTIPAVKQNDSLVKNPITAAQKNIPVTAPDQPFDSTLQYAYIKSVIKKADSVFITADFIQYLTGDKALAEAKKNGDADTAYNDNGKITYVYVANDYYILNSSKKLRQLPLAKMYQIETLSSTTLKKTTLQNFIKKYPYDNYIFTLEFKNGEVI
jgi:hypothetical protein